MAIQFDELQMDAEEGNKDRSVGRVAEGFYRGRAGWAEWRKHLLSCIFHRRFRLAYSILQHVLQNLGVSQDAWLWRIITIVLANLPDADDAIFENVFKMMHFTKSTDYDERRLCFILQLFKMNNFDLGIKLLKKDMPVKMKSGIKVREDPATQAYLDRSHANFQMWRAIVAFWQTDKPDQTGGTWMFDWQKLEGLEDVDGDTSVAPVQEEVEETVQVLVDPSVPAKRKRKPKPVDPIQNFMNATGEEVISRYSVEKLLEMFETFLRIHQRMDVHVVHISQILLAANLTTKLRRLLETYRERNPTHPTAQKFLLDFYLKFYPDDREVRASVLKQLVTLVPNGAHVTQFCKDHMAGQEANEDSGSISEEEIMYVMDVITHALYYEYHRYDTVCWGLLVKYILYYETIHKPGVKELLKEFCNQVRPCWEFFHFRRVTPKDDEELLYYKVVMCYFLFGTGDKYSFVNPQSLSPKKQKAFKKVRAGLDVMRDMFPVQEEEIWPMGTAS